MARDRYDYVIVGGGSAGCALANRLSTDPGNRVLVLEAGRSDYPFDVFVHMPAALTFPSGNPLYDWRYASEPEPHLHNRPTACPTSCAWRTASPPRPTTSSAGTAARS
jgi:choline dehydrogenase